MRVCLSNETDWVGTITPMKGWDRLETLARRLPVGRRAVAPARRVVGGRGFTRPGGSTRQRSRAAGATVRWGANPAWLTRPPAMLLPGGLCKSRSLLISGILKELATVRSYANSL
jgi:hypothetical protein